jgi:heat shock protein HslJ
MQIFPENTQKVLLSSAIILVLTGCVNPVKNQHNGLVGAWKIVHIEGENVTSNSAKLIFSATGTVNGNSGCNRLMGTYRPVHDHLNLSVLASTKMLCANANNADEMAFSRALPRIEHFLVADKRLFLTDEQDKTLIALLAE